MAHKDMIRKDKIHKDKPSLRERFDYTNFFKKIEYQIIIAARTLKSISSEV